MQRNERTVTDREISYEEEAAFDLGGDSTSMAQLSSRADASKTQVSVTRFRLVRHHINYLRTTTKHNGFF